MGSGASSPGNSRLRSSVPAGSSQCTSGTPWHPEFQPPSISCRSSLRLRVRLVGDGSKRVLMVERSCSQPVRNQCKKGPIRAKQSRGCGRLQRPTEALVETHFCTDNRVATHTFPPPLLPSAPRLLATSSSLTASMLSTPSSYRPSLGPRTEMPTVRILDLSISIWTSDRSPEFVRVKSASGIRIEVHSCGCCLSGEGEVGAGGSQRRCWNKSDRTVGAASGR